MTGINNAGRMNGMKMKKFLNDPNTLTAEMLEGLALAHGDIVDVLPGNLVVSRTLKDADRVTIVTLGGTGHEPALSGFVGDGMLDIAVAGDVFAAPNPQSCFEAIKLADRGRGVLFLVLNHAGDMLTGNMTMKMCKQAGLNVRKVVTQEDISNAPGPTPTTAGDSLALFLSTILLRLRQRKADPLTKWQTWPSATPTAWPP